MQLLSDDFHLLGLGCLLGGHARDLLLQLLDPLLQLILLAEPRLAPQFEQLAFAGERLLHVRVVRLILELLWRWHAVRAVPFRA